MATNDYIEHNRFDPNVLMKRAEELGDDWAEKDASFGMLDDAKKTLLGKLVSDKLDGGITVSKAEYYAQGHADYAEHIKALGEARKEKNLALVKYNTYKKWIDLIQTKEANKRAEMMIK
jgi:hypothetical protein